MKTRVANFCAAMSAKRWNKIAPLRRVFRHCYQYMGLYWIQHNPDYLAKVRATGTLSYDNLYPWPYRDKEHFAAWEENDDTLIGDPAGYVIRRSTSFCATMIFLVTGRWLSKKRQHARGWVETLAANGFTEIVDRPKNGQPCIGVQPDYGEYGQLYWFVAYETDENGQEVVCCSSYENFEYRLYRINNPSDEAITWVKIS